LRAHGHWIHGRLEDAELCSNPGFGISMARQGYIVFAYDMVGYNDTRQTPHEFGTPQEYLWGFGPLGLQLWDSTRALDFLQSLPDVDPDQIGMTGASGGGTQTFLLSAVDDRVKVCAPVNMVSAIMQGGSACENAPNLRNDTYNVEIAAMMAPRPMILVSSQWDQSRNTMTEESVVIRGIYSLFARRENLEAVQIEAQHNYNRASREAVYRFFGEHFGKTPAEIMTSEQPFTAEKPRICWLCTIASCRRIPWIMRGCLPSGGRWRGGRVNRRGTWGCCGAGWRMRWQWRCRQDWCRKWRVTRS
jgi:dienelactone hydrolase